MSRSLATALNCYLTKRAAAAARPIVRSSVHKKRFRQTRAVAPRLQFSRNFSGAAATRHDSEYDLALQFAAEQAKHDLATAAAAIADAEESLVKMKHYGIKLSREDLVEDSKAAMMTLLQGFGVCTDQEVEKVLASADTNGDGVLDLREFDEFVTDLRRSIHGRGEDPMDASTGCPHAL